MFRSGRFVATSVRDYADDAVQPNGLDLTVEAVFQQRSAGYVGTDGKSVGDREPVDPDDDGIYRLDPGAYIVRYGETLAVPEDHVGFVLPRSTLLRNSCTLDTAVWDAGYEGRGEGLLEVHHRIEIEQGSRLGQFVLSEADHVGKYDGEYQGENADESSADR
jgi:deoxycytidine triphosphate deaminase